MENLKLNKIANKYLEIEYNKDNYSVGGGLVRGGRFASNRHEDAKYDDGKLTQGKVVQLFKKSTGLDTEYIKSVIDFTFPDMEWHHAGRLPSQYGGGMKKTYFLNSSEIVDLATNFELYCEKYDEHIKELKEERERLNNIEQIKSSFLKENAVKHTRIVSKPAFFYETYVEMNGKYGWFCSNGKSYNMTEYYSGWEFSSEEQYKEFLKL